MKLGEMIRVARLQRKATQQDLGEALGTTQQRISLIEMGRTLPNEEEVDVLCGIFSLPKTEVQHQIGWEQRQDRHDLKALPEMQELEMCQSQRAQVHEPE